MATPKRYLILPARGLTTHAAAHGLNFLTSLAGPIGARVVGLARRAAGTTPAMRVLDSVHENGAKLVELAADQVAALRTSEPGVRVVPEVFYRSAHVLQPKITKKVTAAAGTAAVKIVVTVTRAGVPVKGADVVAFTDFAQGFGAQATTNASGKASLALGEASKKIERLFVFPASGAWPMLKSNVIINSSTVLKLTPIDFSFADSVRHFYGKPALTVGDNVKVGIIDTGVANHPDLLLDGGLNTVTGEIDTDFGDNGTGGHGTHVAGIVAARGAAPTGLRGIAPGVTLRSYRVFGKNDDGASNFAIMKAIDAAVADGCDLINMSLGGGDEDPATSDAIEAARAAGVVVLAANGNDDRSPVSFPAAFDRCLAVSAFGRKGTFPAGTATQSNVQSPFGTNPKDFVASFSNIGVDTDLTGPGVGVVSTVPSGYAVMDGTSMACPAATGALARELSKNPAILSMARDDARSNAIVSLFVSKAGLRGFGALFEGRGMIKP